MNSTQISAAVSTACGTRQDAVFKHELSERAVSTPTRSRLEGSHAREPPPATSRAAARVRVAEPSEAEQ